MLNRTSRLYLNFAAKSCICAVHHFYIDVARQVRFSKYNVHYVRFSMCGSGSKLDGSISQPKVLKFGPHSQQPFASIFSD